MTAVAAPADPSSRRIALVVQYLGKHYHGWQRQANGISVQQVMEETIAAVCGHAVTLSAAGRTDTGVHASGQVVHFDTTCPVPPERWARILSDRLPKDILALQSVAVSKNWHARFSACWRRYRYTIYTASVPNLFLRDFSWHYYYAPLDCDRMGTALDSLLGTQDLAAFQMSGSDRSHSWVTVQDVQCWREGDFLSIEVQASGFLYGMMRLLVAMLVDVGRSRISVEEFGRIWRDRRRDRVKYAAPPQGLCLIGVGYDPDPFGGATLDRSQHLQEVCRVDAGSRALPAIHATICSASAV